jgi:hypothetical protein
LVRLCSDVEPEFRSGAQKLHGDLTPAALNLAEANDAAFELVLIGEIQKEEVLAASDKTVHQEQAAGLVGVHDVSVLVKRLIIRIGTVDEQGDGRLRALGFTAIGGLGPGVRGGAQARGAGALLLRLSECIPDATQAGFLGKAD